MTEAVTSHPERAAGRAGRGGRGGETGQAAGRGVKAGQEDGERPFDTHS